MSRCSTPSAVVATGDLALLRECEAEVAMRLGVVRVVRDRVAPELLGARRILFLQRLVHLRLPAVRELAVLDRVRVVGGDVRDHEDDRRGVRRQLVHQPLILRRTRRASCIRIDLRHRHLYCCAAGRRRHERR